MKKNGRFNRFLRILGPGLVTGAADDDPSGIATYSQTGAQFGYGQLWVAVFTLPFMTAIQEACARIGKVTGKGIVAVMKERYGRTTVISAVALVLVANTVNIGADIGAMAASARLLVPSASFAALSIGFAAAMLILQIFLSYRSYARILKWLALFMFSYVATALIVSEPWGTILRATFIPHIELSFPFLFIIVGVIGTTISPYMFFWEADEEVEEGKLRHIGKDEGGRPQVTKKEMGRMRFDNFLGMLSSNVVTWCIIVTAATVLNANGVMNIGTAADAAKALEPLVRGFPDAGFVAKLLFSSGVIGLGFLAVPVLSSSASYAVAEAFDWKRGLAYKFKRAHGFYGVITVATLVGLLINFIGIDPVRALVVTAVINGVIAVPLIFFIARIAADERIMGEHKSGWLSKTFVWGTFGLMSVAAVAMFASSYAGSGARIDESAVALSPQTEVAGAAAGVPGQASFAAAAPASSSPATTSVAIPLMPEIARGDATKQQVIFTFDGGGTTDSADAILAALAKHHAKGTFFLTGKMVEAHPDLVRRIVAAGHEIFSHTYDHPHLSTLSDEKIAAEFGDFEKAIAAAGGPPPHPYFRAPYGDRDARVLADAAKAGYRSVYWTVDALDWKSPKTISASDVEARILSQIGPGYIYLMHIGDPTTGAILDDVFSKLESKGYKIVSLTQGI